MPAEIEHADVALAKAALVELAGFLSELGATIYKRIEVYLPDRDVPLSARSCMDKSTPK
jgi:hypothetical protein